MEKPAAYQVTSPTSIVAQGEFVIVLPLTGEQASESGIITNTGTTEKHPDRGVVLSIGPEAEDHLSTNITIGETEIIFVRGQGQYVDQDDHRLLALKVENVIGFVKD